MRYEKFIRSNFEVAGTSGSEFNCRCPWHEDKGKPNLYINGERGLFICHSCGKKGHLGQLESFDDRVTLIDVQRGLDELRMSLVPTKEEPAMYPGHLAMLDSGIYDRSSYWVTERRFTKATIRKFELGYDFATHSVTVPLYNEVGRLLGVMKRMLSKDIQPKYVLPKGFEKNKVLFGIGYVTDHNDIIAITEGPLDAIACWNAGVPAVAMFGSSLSQTQAEILMLKGIWRVVVMTDNDVAGRKALASIVSALSGVMVHAGNYEGISAKDPGEMSPSQIRKMFENAEPWYQMPYEELEEVRYTYGGN